MRIVAIVPAAGKSRRMGAQNKLLLPWNGETILGHVVETLAGAGLEEILVVTGHESGLIAKSLAEIPCQIVFNPDYELGMGTSISAGIRAASDEADGVLIALGDMPFITKELVLRICGEGSPDQIVVPNCGDRLGQPILFGREFRSELLRLEGDKGAKFLLGRHADKVKFIEVDDEHLFDDVDQPDEYANKAERDCSLSPYPEPKRN